MSAIAAFLVRKLGTCDDEIPLR